MCEEECKAATANTRTPGRSRAALGLRPAGVKGRQRRDLQHECAYTYGHTRNHHDLTSYASRLYLQPGVTEQVTGVWQLVVVLPSGNVLT